MGQVAVTDVQGSMAAKSFASDPNSHTYLEEKYVQEAAAEANYKPKYMHKIRRGYGPGRGPTAVGNPKNYNQKLTSFIEDSLYECEDRP